MYEFRMPSMGADMEAGTLSQWLVRPGDTVKRGDVIAIIETEKSDIEVEIFASGVVDKILIEKGQRVPVGTLLATLATNGEAAALPALPTGGAPSPTLPRADARERAPSALPASAELAPVPVAPAPVTAIPSPVPPSPPPAQPPGADAANAADVANAANVADVANIEPPGAVAPSPAKRGRVGEGVQKAPSSASALRASPVARRRARELGINLAAVTGSGPGGAVTLADVEKLPPPPPRRHAHAVARKMAEELGIDLSRVAGTGVGGVITKADVEAAARGPLPEPATAPPPPAAAETGPRDRAASMRRAIGAAMARSKREIPHYYLSTTIDASRALAWLAQENLKRPVEERLLPAALLLKAVALALREVPELNGFWVDGAFQPSAAIHVGVAVSLRGGGLIAPAIHDADRRSLGELMAALRDLVRRTRAGSLRSSEVSDPTVTVTNLGDQGVETVFGVIYPPQVALVGLGTITEKPWAENGMLAARPVLTATLSADHRASDGHRGALFLAALDRLLQAPENL